MKKSIHDIEKATDDELVAESIECDKLFSSYSCDCLGFYISAINKEITKRNIWLKVHAENKKHSL